VLPSGELLIGARTVTGNGDPIHGFNPITGAQLDPSFGTATAQQLDQACGLAAEAFASYRDTSLSTRSGFLRIIASNIEALGEDLIATASTETGLPRARIEGERARTVGQLRLFADVVADGEFIEARVDPAIEDRKPSRRPDIRQCHIGLGPVAVFGASNFPLAFSVAGGDTASALAAGCPVIVKAHSAHPGTSELVGRAIQQAVRDAALHEGVFSLLFGSGHALGADLVADSRIKAAGFTGSRRGGLALLAVAQSRREPIPFYAEMSSVNPVLLLPAALAGQGREIARNFVAALTLGAGQFCTNPGLVLAIESAGLEAFLSEAASALGGVAAAPMLTREIHSSYVGRTQQLSDHAHVEQVGRGREGGRCHCQAALFTTEAEAFRRHPELAEEVFGAASLVVRCRDIEQMRTIVTGLEGQLTVSLHLGPDDVPEARRLLPLLELKAGRIVINGFATGVEVGHAMVHGGPFPATSDVRSTSVGSLAIRRFLRPIAYQDLPDTLLPDSLKEGNPLGISRLMNGQRESR
jgi:2,5-dioxopentanoate dehydrogenase